MTLSSQDRNRIVVGCANVSARCALTAASNADGTVACDSDGKPLLTPDTQPFEADFDALAEDLQDEPTGEEKALFEASFRKALAALLEDEMNDEDLEELRAAAGQAGDLDQVALCDRALEGDYAARAECLRVVQDAEAQRDQ